MVRRKNIQTFNSLFHSVYLFFFLIGLTSIADLFSVGYLWDVCNKDKLLCRDTSYADILVASLGLLSFARIACLMQL